MGQAGQGFTVETTELVAGAGKADSANDATQSTLSDLFNALAPLAGQWDDEASRSFQQVMQRYQDAQRKLGEALTGISEVLRSTATNYDQAAETNAEGFTKMTGAFPV